ncbi:MAG: Dabb family protein [Clostridia bacterium]|nr:Dabb family protein [Clostridia bacterium]
MVKHVILWKLKSEYNTDAIKTDMKQSLEALVGVVPGLLSLHVQITALSTSANADVMLDSTFESPEALAGYAKHPAHVLAADTKVRPFTESRACLDFIVE